MNSCDLCQKIKNRKEASAGKLMANKILEKPWKYLMVNFIAKLLSVVEKDVILVVCNRLSKITYFMVTTEGMSAEGLAILFGDNVWKLHELPESIILDRELQFVVKLMKELNKMLEIKIRFLIAFYSQTDGKTKFMN